MKKNLKHIISAIVLAVYAFIAIGSIDEGDSSTSPSSSTKAENSFNTRQLGETLSTQYFDVTVNKVSVRDRVNTGNQWTDLEKENGNQYLILNITFKNTDNESRLVFDGDVIIVYNGKEFLFDSTETVMLEGWGTFEQINPLTSITTNIVYKIPSEIKGPAFYRPSRSDRMDLIVIGNIE